MKMQKLFAISVLPALLSALCLRPLASQDVTQPLSPHLDVVTVDPATGFAIVRWLPSPSPDVGSYVVYTFSAGTASAVDTVRSPFITEYTHTSSAARYMSVTYVVAAMDSSLNISPLSNSLSTIWLTSAIDVCTAAISVEWTPYENPDHPGTGYQLNILREGGDNPPPIILPPADTEYLFSGYDPETGYCFYITVLDGGGTLSGSNSACVTTGSEVAPEWVRIDAVEVSGNGIGIRAAYDPATDMDTYELSVYSTNTASWQRETTSTGISGEVSFFLSSADTTVVNLYRVAALNSCGLPSTLSGTARNMVLTSSGAGTVINLQWNRPVVGGTETFTLWRDTGGGPQEVITGISDTIWSDDYTAFAGEVSAPEVVYRVTAVASTPAAPEKQHISSAAVIETTENIFVPNAFTPGTPGENALFRPRFSFMPENYDFRIWSRNGVLLFHTSDYEEGWDGMHMGVNMPSGVYLWSVRLTTPSGRTETRNGTVTILP